MILYRRRILQLRLFGDADKLLDIIPFPLKYVKNA
jgi:hypothetical protein